MIGRDAGHNRSLLRLVGVLAFVATLTIGIAAPVHSQQIRVQGILLDRVTGTGIQSARIRLGDASYLTDVDGRFIVLVDAAPAVLRFDAPGYMSDSLMVHATADTLIRIFMAPRPIPLPELSADARLVRLQGVVHAVETGDRLLQAEIRVGDPATVVGALNGRFEIDRLIAGREVTLEVTSPDYLPKSITVSIAHDTLIRIDLAADPVAATNRAQQIKRLERRAYATGQGVRNLNHDAILRSGAPSIAVLLQRSLPNDVIGNEVRPSREICMTLDERIVRWHELRAMPAEALERIESIGFRGRSERGTSYGMVRMYTRAFVRKLAQEQNLLPISNNRGLVANDCR